MQRRRQARYGDGQIVQIEKDADGNYIINATKHELAYIFQCYFVYAQNGCEYCGFKERCASIGKHLCHDVGMPLRLAVRSL